MSVVQNQHGSRRADSFERGREGASPAARTQEDGGRVHEDGRRAPSAARRRRRQRQREAEAAAAWAEGPAVSAGQHRVAGLQRALKYRRTPAKGPRGARITAL